MDTFARIPEFLVREGMCKTMTRRVTVYRSN